MKILNLTQGSDEWLAARSKYHTASEAPSMMGQGKVSRSELLRMKATGDEQEFSKWVLEVLFAKGHEIEELARPIAEGILGDELFPITAVDDAGFLLASFDGATMCESIIWECKQWNDAKAADVGHGVLPAADFWQVYQQLLVSGPEKCLYTVTDGTSERTVYIWVEPDAALFQQLLASWAQFDVDLESFVPIAPVVEAVGRAPEDLPALRLEVSGMVSASNLDAFREHALAVFSGINTELSTDTDFADAEKTVKWCKSVEDKLEAAKKQALEQTASIDALFQAIDAIKGEARTKRLELDKLVKSRKVAVRGEILTAGNDALAAHMKELNAGFFQSGVTHPGVPVDFAGAMKGKRTIASLRDAVDTELARVKVEAGAVAAKMHSNLALFKAEAEGYESLFADLRQLVTKAPEDLVAVVKTRIADFQAEQQRIVDAEAKATESAPEVPYQQREPAAQPSAPARGRFDTTAAVADKKATRPSDRDILQAVASAFNVEVMVARSWLKDMLQREVA